MTENRKAAGGMAESRIGGRVKGRMAWLWHYLRGKEGKGVAWCCKV